ncbi:helix-turn-helix domain-containing protein [Streptomyces asoensis]|uniref:helix-turn-helix domain-containing protein n=1 Tax=Streptomyces asoensis TaxID=249586 RepID=UPI00371DB46A
MGRRSKALPTENGAPEIVGFAALLRDIRKRAGSPTLSAMAKETGVSTASLSKAAGGCELPSWRTANAYAEACGADADELRKVWETVRRKTRPKEFVSNREGSLNLSPEQRRRASWTRMWERWDRTGSILPSHRSETLLDLRISMQAVQNYRSLSLRQLARLMPYSHSTVAAVLAGARPVTAYFLRSFLHACGVTSSNELILWMDLLKTADPRQKRAVWNIGNEVYSNIHSSTAWRPNLPISEEIERLKKFSLGVRSEHLRKWLLSNMEEKVRRTLYRRMERIHSINAAHLTLFERGEWNLTLEQLNRLARESKQRGYTDIDPLIQSALGNTP